MLTWMEDSRLYNSTRRAIFCMESEFQVEKAQLLHLNMQKQETRTCENQMLDLILFWISLFQNRFIG